jgi:hypothetical protein
MHAAVSTLKAMGDEQWRSAAHSFWVTLSNITDTAGSPLLADDTRRATTEWCAEISEFLQLLYSSPGTMSNSSD